ncbi:MAG: hypothetical protein ACE5JF_11340 [Anaerolineales bacterium]
MTVNSEHPTADDEAVSHAELAPGYDDYAGEIQVANGTPPRWLTRLPYFGVVVALAYYAYVGASDPVNLVFEALLIIWLIYTPIAKKRGWFFIAM